jgi:hypothetical protein
MNHSFIRFVAVEISPSNIGGRYPQLLEVSVAGKETNAGITSWAVRASEELYE